MTTATARRTRIIVQQQKTYTVEGETVSVWADVEGMGEHPTSHKAKAAISEKGEPGCCYRVAHIKWQGNLADPQDTIFAKRGA